MILFLMNYRVIFSFKNYDVILNSFFVLPNIYAFAHFLNGFYSEDEPQKERAAAGLSASKWYGWKQTTKLWWLIYQNMMLHFVENNFVMYSCSLGLLCVPQVAACSRLYMGITIHYFWYESFYKYPGWFHLQPDCISSYLDRTNLCALLFPFML